MHLLLRVKAVFRHTARQKGTGSHFWWKSATVQKEETALEMIQGSNILFTLPNLSYIFFFLAKSLMCVDRSGLKLSARLPYAVCIHDGTQ